jgi:copper oxidase (laccase) domain-containing protein
MPADGLVGGAPPEAGGAPPKRDDTEVLAMFAADCALLGVVSPEGVVGVVHCGWRGLLAGIVQAVASEMRSRGASRLAALRSPCICPSCYEFGRSDLEPLAARYGSSVVSTTSSGALSLDLRAGVRRAAEEAEIDRLYEADACTSCEPGWFSYRARGDSARFSLAVAA